MIMFSTSDHPLLIDSPAADAASSQPLLQAYSGTGGTISAQVLLTDSATVLSSEAPTAPGIDSAQTPLIDSATVEAASFDGDDNPVDRVLEEDVTFDAEDVFADAALSPEQLNEGSTAPTGVVMMYLTSVREQLIGQMDGNTWPKIYLQGQFWLHPPDPFFAMYKAANSSGGLNPDQLYYPSIFLWLPHLLDK